MLSFVIQMLTGILYSYGLIDMVQKYEGLKYVYLFDYRFVGGYSHSGGGQNGRYLGRSSILNENAGGGAIIMMNWFFLFIRSCARRRYFFNFQAK